MSAPVFPLDNSKNTLYNWQVPALGFDASVDSYRPIAVGSNGAIVSDSTSGEYETVAASQSGQILGATGAVGDYLASLIIVPATTSPGAVSIADGNGSAITVFTGGATSVADLKPFTVLVGMRAIVATTPGWHVTTGTNVSVIGVGNFT